MLTSDPAWWAAAAAPVRRQRVRISLVDADGVDVVDLPARECQIDYRGHYSEVWAGSLTVDGDEWIPSGPEDLLDPRSGYRVRVYWSLWVPGHGWVEQTICTLLIDDPVTDRGVSVTLRDPLADAKRGGYAGQYPLVGSMTVPEALSVLMDAAAPQVRLRTQGSDVLLPVGYQLGDRQPGEDWTEIAALAGWRLVTARDGVVVAGPVVPPGTEVLDWSEGPDCPVVPDSPRRETAYSATVNRVVVRSTNPDLPAPIVAVAEDDDDSSPTWTGNFVHELRIGSDAVASQAAADAMAALQLAGLRRPTEAVSVQVPPRPDLDYLQPVVLRSRAHGVGGQWAVTGWSWNVTEGSMTMDFATRGLP